MEKPGRKEKLETNMTEKEARASFFGFDGKISVI